MSSPGSSSTVPAAPPADSFWRKYSPNHEMPVAITASVLLHVLVGVAIVVSGMAIVAALLGETSPPKIEVAFIPIGSGDPNSGGGGGGTPGAVGAKQEFIEQKDPAKTDAAPTIDKFDVVPQQPSTPEIDIPAIPNSDVAIPKFEVMPTPKPGVKNPGKGGPGTGGGLGSGVGTGVGPGKGPGQGAGEPGVGGGGPGATRAEIRAQRWRFNFSGSPREHLQKLIATGITLGFTDAKNDLYLINDLKARPVNWRAAQFNQFKDTVKWYSQAPASVVGLARELRMPGPPAQFVLFLPADREQLIADAEFAYAKSSSRDPQRIEETWFDFRIQGGKLEPFVQRQMYRD